MQLDPIYLLAPKPNPPSIPTRRAFLFAASTFALGSAVGGACGYTIAAGSGPEAEAELVPSGDVELDELRRLAVKAPIAELVERRLVFLNSLSKDYRKDEVLWRGVERLSAAILEDASFPDRTISGRLVAQIIELAEPTYRTRFSDIARRLRAIK